MSKNTEIPDDVSDTLLQVLESHKLTLEQDSGIAGMGAPTEEETEEAYDWVMEHC